MTMLLMLVALICSCVASLVITPAVLIFAQRFGLTDKPDNHRKLHGRPIPLGGGLAIFLSLSLVVTAVWLAGDQDSAAPSLGGASFFGLFLAAVVIVITGLLDDRYGLRGRHKLLGQLCAACILASSGLVMGRVEVFGFYIELGPFAVPFTIFWLLGAINALNLLDGIDGLATTVGAILCLSVAVMAILINRQPEAVIAMALAGSLIGFLRYNFPPARIFLGDAGSMLIGLMVGALAIRAALKGPATFALAAPMAVWAIPIFDSTAAILRRKLTGRSIYTTDRAHLHHCLMARLGSSQRVLAYIGICCALTSAGALISVWLGSDVYAAAAVGIVIATLVATRMFGHVETKLLASKMKSAGVSFLLPRMNNPTTSHHSTVRMQGSREWELLWSTLVEFTDKLGLQSINLNVSLPAVQEGFHASWKRRPNVEAESLWRTEVPLFVGKQSVGRLSVSGQHNGEPVCDLLQKLLELIEPFEVRLTELTREPKQVANLISRRGPETSSQVPMPRGAVLSESAL